MLTLIPGGKEEDDLYLNQELEAIEEQTSRLVQFKQLSPRQRLLIQNEGLKEAVESLHETLFWITERYC